MVKVAYLHPTTTAVLYQLASTANPDVASLWKKIQALDKQISSEGISAGQNELIKNRELLESDLSKA